MKLTHWADKYVKELRERAERMAAYGDDRGAKIAELHAQEIEQRRVEFENEEISAEDGAIESGYTAVHLRMLRRTGHWSGRRADLPKRPAEGPPAPELVASDPSGQTISLADKINAGRTSKTRSG